MHGYAILQDSAERGGARLGGATLNRVCIQRVRGQRSNRALT